MLASELVAKILDITKSPDHDADDVLALINEGLIEIAGGGDRPHGDALVPPLPGLFTSETITFDGGESTVSLPSTYQRGLKRVEFDGEQLKRYDSLIEFLDDYAGETGTDPEAYVLIGNVLHVGPICSTDKSIKVYFYAYPEELEIVEYDAGPPEVAAIDDEPTCIPKHLHRKLLVNYACKEIYSEIEQGLDGANPDTIKHTKLYGDALDDLERFLGPEDGIAVNIGD